MSSQSPEALYTPPALIPLPEDPPPRSQRPADGLRQRRSADGLRLLRFAMYASFATHALSTLPHHVGRNDTRAVVVLYLLSSVLYLLTNLALAVGLWRFGTQSAATGATRPARLSFMCLVLAMALPLLVFLSFALPAPALRDRHDLMMSVLMLSPVALHALRCAGLALLVRALGAVLRSAGEPPSAPAWWATAAYLVCGTLSIPHVLVTIPHEQQTLVWVPVLVAEAAVVLALGPVIRRAAAVLARRDRPLPMLG